MRLRTGSPRTPGGPAGPRALSTRTKLLLLVPLVCILASAYLFVNGFTSGAALAVFRGGAASPASGPAAAAGTHRQQQSLGGSNSNSSDGHQASDAAARKGGEQDEGGQLRQGAPSPATLEEPAVIVLKVDLEKAALYREAHRAHREVLPGVRQLNNTPDVHCGATRPGWCGPYWTQPLLPAVPPPRYDKPCPHDCNSVGVCDHSTGVCRCPAGWQGNGCEVRKPRICANMGPDGRDKNLTVGGWVHTRCSGLCDDTIGMCYCPPETKYGRKVAPDAKPGDKPLQEGRPMYWCNPNKTADGQRVPWSWNVHTHEGVFGPEGFCNADKKPIQRCGCTLDGLWGETCEKRVTQFCPNQCTGNGECQLGFCKCRDGWFGHDCAQRRKGLPFDEPGFNKTQRNETGPSAVTAQVPSAHDPPSRPFRKRPFIYVYELPPRYNNLMLQYRLESGICTYRLFDDQDRPFSIPYTYGAESLLHELMLTTEHRTFDPEEADYFYIPAYISCLADFVGKAPEPFWPLGEDGSAMWSDRAYRMSMMALEAKEWLEHNLPYWNRTGGRDHIWAFTHDEAPCYQHQSLWNSIWLTHWGRLDFPHKSNTQYGPDNYSWDKKHSSLPHGWIADSSGKHPCHDPVNHLVIPAFKGPQHYGGSPFLRKAIPKRDILAFFRGDMRLDRDPECKYSRCIRQTLYNLSKTHQWREKHNVWYGGYKDTEGDYTDLLARSKFCLVLPGDGWSPRMEDSILHGCVPVIIMDGVMSPFESILDYSRFTIRVAEKDMAKVVDVLLNVTEQQYQYLQGNVSSVWMRYRWNSVPLVEHDLYWIVRHNLSYKKKALEQPGTEWTQTGDDDAFSTIVQWLYSRLPEMDLLHLPHNSGGAWASDAAARVAAAEAAAVGGASASQ